MIESAREWLPDSAFSNPALGLAVSTVVEEWARGWLGVRAPAVQAIPRIVAERRLAPGKTWRCLADGVWLEWSEATRLAYVRLALDRAGRDKSPSDDDQQLLILLADRMVRDLGTDLAKLLGCPSAPSAEVTAPRGGMLASWGGQAGLPTLELLIAQRVLVPLRKRQCPAWSATRAAQISLHDALGDQQIAFEAMLGKASLSAADLRDIAEGDVVVIGPSARNEIELRRVGTERVLAHAVLARDDDQLKLKARNN